MGTKETTDRRKLTPEQWDNMIEISYEISEIKQVIKHVSIEDERKRFIVFMSANEHDVAVSSLKGVTMRNSMGDPIPTTYDPQLFEVIRDYFERKNQLLLEEAEAVISGEGGER